MQTVAQILKSKPEQTVHTIEPAASVYEAVKLMANKNVGALVVVELGRVVGIVSERDYARKVVLLARSSRDTPLRHLPVMDGGELVGLVSIGDLVKATISEQQYIIEQLEHYISGQRD